MFVVFLLLDKSELFLNLFYYYYLRTVFKLFGCCYNLTFLKKEELK